MRLHNTRNTDQANAWTGIEERTTGLDSSFGGVGNSPLTLASTGNVPTEDIVYMLKRAGIDTGVDVSKAISAAVFLEAALEKSVLGMVMKAEVFPQH